MLCRISDQSVQLVQNEKGTTVVLKNWEYTKIYIKL